MLQPELLGIQDLIHTLNPLSYGQHDELLLT